MSHESADILVLRFDSYHVLIPELCHTMQQYYVTWISPNYYMSLAAIMFRYSQDEIRGGQLFEFPIFSRFVLLKYADRGLANDRYYYNMNMSLFNGLFWLGNIVLFTINQGGAWAYFIKHGRSLYQNAYKYCIVHISSTFCKTHLFIVVFCRALLCKMVQTQDDFKSSHKYSEVVSTGCVLPLTFIIVHWRKLKFPRFRILTR